MQFDFEQIRFTLFYPNSLFESTSNLEEIFSLFFSNEPSSFSSNKASHQRNVQSLIGIENSSINAKIDINNNRLDIILDLDPDSSVCDLDTIKKIMQLVLDKVPTNLPPNPVRIALGLLASKSANSIDESINYVKDFLPAISSINDLAELGIRLNKKYNFDNIDINGIISINSVKQIRKKIAPNEFVFFQIPQSEMQDACICEFDFNTAPEIRIENKNTLSILNFLKDKIFLHLKEGIK
jgi:hypothetical protein